MLSRISLKSGVLNRVLLALFCLLWLPLFKGQRVCQGAETNAATRKIVLIAGPKSHGPVGNGIHDYGWSVQLLKVMLDNSDIADQVRVEYHLEGWPEEPETLNDADTIMVVSDGRDGDLFEEAPHFSTPEKQALIQKQIDRGCGFVTFHFSTFAPDAQANAILDWSGAYFDWETDGKREWYSAIQTHDTEIQPVSPEHPVSNGLQPFRMNEEFYFNLRFAADDQSVTPILGVPVLPGREPDGRIVAWARQRAEGGRGFGTTCGHFYENWKQPEFRRMVLNALAWTAHVDVPADGVNSRYFNHEVITQALTGRSGTERAVVDDRPIKVLILSGAHHPGHLWQETTPVLKSLLERDPRMQVDVSESIEDLATPLTSQYDLLVQNYCNWEQPGLSEAAKSGFVNYLKNGGGLIIVHFANGAFHASLPNAAASDWPEYRRICRRVWDHAPGTSGHDSYGRFIVEIDDTKHPVTRGMEAFPTTDELYFRQQGNDPIHVLASARSNVTGEFEPMAFVYDYEQARVFQTVLGHAPDSIRNDGTSSLIRRAAAWVAGRDQIPDTVLRQSESAKQFGKGLNAARGSVVMEPRPEYSQFPLTVECWAKIDNSTSFQILLANDDKSSASHWELFTMPGTGELTAYLPGQTPDHVRSSARICDGTWHHIAMTAAPGRVCLFVDGQQVAEQDIQPRGGAVAPLGLAIGSLLTRELGFAGVLDDVRISQGIRTITLPTEPAQNDAQTIGLWRFDEVTPDNQIPDESSFSNPAQEPDAIPAVSATSAGSVKDHWGEEAIGFKWTEGDSVDNRWNQMEIGPFLASTLPLPGQSSVAKGLSIRIGETQQASICFDTEHLTFRAAWTEGFLNFNPARFGLIASPVAAGPFLFHTAPPSPSTSDSRQFDGFSVHGDRVVLRYRINGSDVIETPWGEMADGAFVFTRTMELPPHRTGVSLPILTSDTPPQLTTVDGVRLAQCSTGWSADSGTRSCSGDSFRSPAGPAAGSDHSRFDKSTADPTLIRPERSAATSPVAHTGQRFGFNGITGITATTGTVPVDRADPDAGSGQSGDRPVCPRHPDPPVREPVSCPDVHQRARFFFQRRHGGLHGARGCLAGERN